jgi:hypothetical protein
MTRIMIRIVPFIFASGQNSCASPIPIMSLGTLTLDTGIGQAIRLILLLQQLADGEFDVVHSESRLPNAYR